jgi:hypothetical protein
MIFNLERERLNHPQARLIPEFIWETYFSGRLEDGEIQLMQAPQATLNNALDPFRYKSTAIKLRYWLCIIFSQPRNDRSISSTEVSSFLNMDPRAEFILAARTGDIEAIKQCLDRPNTDAVEMIKANSYEAFMDAVKEGHLNVIQKFMEILGDDRLEMIKADNYAAFYFAAQYGHFNIVEELIKHVGANHSGND